MNLNFEKINYVFADEHSENDAILIGYLSTTVRNTIKELKRKNTNNVITVNLSVADNFISYDLEDFSQQQNFNWEMCEALYLIKAYNTFTPKMKRVFNRYYIDDIPTSQIACEENVSRRAINSIIQRCKEEIEFCRYMEDKEREKKNNN